MQRYIGGYATNVKTFKCLSDWDIKQGQIESMDMVQKADLMLPLYFSLKI